MQVPWLASIHQLGVLRRSKWTSAKWKRSGCLSQQRACHRQGGYLPTSFSPLKDQSNNLHPLATGIKRMPWHAACGLNAPDPSNHTHVKPKPKVPRAQVGTALQSFLAQQSLPQAPKAPSKDQKASIASSDLANIKANVPAAPMFARRNIGLPGACKPAAPTKTLANKQAAGTSAKKPPLPAKRALPGSAQQGKTAAPDKRPKAAQQRLMPASADLMEGLAGQNAVRPHTSRYRPDSTSKDSFDPACAPGRHLCRQRAQ